MIHIAPTATAGSAIGILAINKNNPEPRNFRFINNAMARATTNSNVTEKTTVGVVFLPWHFHEAAANLLTNDALDPQAKIPEFKACAVQVFPARDAELPNPDAMLERGRY